MITSVDDLIAGQQQMRFFAKGPSGLSMPTNRWISTWRMAGIPGVGADDTNGMAGTALSSSGGLIPGQVPFFDAPGGQITQLARAWGGTGNNYPLVICDRLWHNSGILLNTTGAQTVNSVAWPARDAFGSTDGFGVGVFIETSALMGAGGPNITMSYTNSDGVPGRSAQTFAIASAQNKHTCWKMMLAAGDFGVRSIQSVTLNATITGAVGGLNLVAYRMVGILDQLTAGQWSSFDPVTGGMAQLYDGTVPFFMYFGTNIAPMSGGGLSYVQG